MISFLTGSDIFIAQALLLEVAGYQVMHENIRHRRELQDDLPAFGLAHVDGNAVLVAIQYGVISLRSGSQIEYHPHGVALRWFDLDDLGAHVSEYLGAAGPGNELCNVGYFDSFKNLHEPASRPDLLSKNGGVKSSPSPGLLPKYLFELKYPRGQVFPI